MSRPLVLAIVLAFALGTAHAAASVPAVAEWPRIESVLPAAAGGDRPIMIELDKPDCPYCARLHDEIWRDPRVATLLAQVTKTRVDISTPAGVTLAVRLKATLFPAVLLVAPTGRVLDRLDGLPSVESARAFLERAAARRVTPSDNVAARLEVGDFAVDAGALKLAQETYGRVADDPSALPEHADNARLKRARAQERLGDIPGAAATLEKFTTAEPPVAGTVRPALDLLIRLRKAQGDREGETRARDAFARLFPALHAPD